MPSAEKAFLEAAASAAWRASEVLQNAVEAAYHELSDEQAARFSDGDPNRLARLLLIAVAAEALRDEFAHETMTGKRDLQILLGKRD